METKVYLAWCPASVYWTGLPETAKYIDMTDNRDCTTPDAYQVQWSMTTPEECVKMAKQWEQEGHIVCVQVGDTYYETAIS